jgi:hypothetical protein
MDAGVSDASVNLARCYPLATASYYVRASVTDVLAAPRVQTEKRTFRGPRAQIPRNNNLGATK